MGVPAAVWFAPVDILLLVVLGFFVIVVHIGFRVKQFTDMVLLSVKGSFGGVMVDEQNLTNTMESVQYRKVEMFIEFAGHKSLNRSERRSKHHFPEMNSAADDNLLTQFLSLTQLSNVMQLKQLSLIHI